jgi:hypothetical protein
VNKLWRASLAPGTVRLYQSAFRSFKQFLEFHSLWTSATLSPPIVTEDTLIFFVAFCVKRNLRYHTIKQYLAGIRHFYVAYSVFTPLCVPSSLCRLQLILRGVRKSENCSSVTRLPVTYQILQQLTRKFLTGVPGSYDGVMLAAASSMAFFGFLRCGEFTVHPTRLLSSDDVTYLRIVDIRFAPDATSFVLHLPQSKTDIFRQGCAILIHATNKAVCPVQLMSTYLLVRRRAGAVGADPLFLTSQGFVLSRSFFVSAFKDVLQRLGFDPNLYNGHSMRIGAATSAGAANVPDHLIKILGRWTSDCYTRYIHTQGKTIQEAQSSMCK